MNSLIKGSIFAAILLLFAALLLLTKRSTTPPILDSEAHQLPESIASLEKVHLGGMDQWILIRGNDVSNPILLWLHGGPGASQMAVARHFNGALEKDFIVVHWDQRGAGKSNPPDFDERTMTFQQFIEDAHELSGYLKTRFNKEKIYLVGHSWGTQIGIKLAQAYPQDFYAYVGVSQVVDPAAAQEVSRAWLLEQIKEEENQEDLKRLDALGPTPYEDHEVFVKYAHMIDAYGGDFDVGMGELFWIALQSPEYRIGDLLAWLWGANRGSGPMWDTLEYRSYNAMVDVPRLHVPVYFFNGRKAYR